MAVDRQRLYHNGRQMANDATMATKPSLLLRLEKDLIKIDNCVSIKELAEYTAPALLEFSVKHNLGCSKTAAKTTLMDSILKFNCPTEDDYGVEINIETPRGRIITKLVRPGDTIKIADFETQADSESTTWWNSEEAAKPQAQFKTDKQ